jgi:hypothetical protein
VKVYDIVYGQSNENKEKTQWLKVGVLIEKEDGKMRIKLDAIPVGNWDGWLGVFEKEKKEK